jgi:hypothetical protein
MLISFTYSALMLEIFHLLWFDTNISSTDDENLNIQKRLQSIVNQFQVFAMLDEFIKYVQKIISVDYC